MNARTKKAFLKELKVRQKALSDERDKLRELKDEFELLEHTASSALESLEQAIDTLSQYV